MLSGNASQYLQTIEGIQGVSLSNSGDKFERFKLTAIILGKIFTNEVWTEWDRNQHLLKEVHAKGIDPKVYYDKTYVPKYKGVYPDWFERPLVRRLARFQINMLVSFGASKIEEYIRDHDNELRKRFTPAELVKFSSGWGNACETITHVFQDFLVFPGHEYVPSDNIDIGALRRLVIRSAMLDTNTFNRKSIRNYNQDVDGVLSHSLPEGISPEFMQGERVGCPAARHFPGINIESTVFDELFVRICEIYGYTQANSPKTSKRCPHHTQVLGA